MTGQLDGTVVKDRVDACGLDIYYEVHGAGEPLLSPGVSLERLRDVQSPTLVLVGDDDCVTPEHAAAMVRALPAGSQLGVVPRNLARAPVREARSR